MSYLPNRFQLGQDLVTFADARPCVITCTDGTHSLIANNATTVTTTGTNINSLYIQAVSATTVNLSSLVNCNDLTLIVSNPTLTLPADVSGSFVFSSTTRTSLVIPASCTSVSINAPNLTTITSIGTLVNSLTNFTLNSTGAVDSTGIELILAACSASGAGVVVDISGGTNVVPTGLGGATAATGEIVVAGAANALSDPGWIKPRWQTTERYFWYSLLGNGDPAPGGYGIQVTINPGDSASDVATALSSAMNANGYSTSVDTTRIYYTLNDPGISMSASSSGGDVSLENEALGSSGNANIDTIYANGGSVSHNT